MSDEGELFFRVCAPTLYETRIQKKRGGPWETGKSGLPYYTACDELDKVRALVRDNVVWDAGLRVVMEVQG